MLTLLIVEDEKLTREGIVSTMPWSELGIGQVHEADDGGSALEIADRVRPDIVLTDVRMPLMNGVELSRLIRRSFPHCKIVFMSGYSDKEYLKAAIEVQAMEYIEKPIVREELKRVLSEAVAQYRQEDAGRRSLSAAESMFRLGSSAIRKELAWKLAHGLEDWKQVDEWAAAGLLRMRSNNRYMTAIVREANVPSRDEQIASSAISLLESELERACEGKGLDLLTYYRPPGYLIAVIYGPSQAVDRDEWLERIRYVCEVSLGKDFFAALGHTAADIKDIPASYSSAAVALQQGFFSGYGHVHTPGTAVDSPLQGRSARVEALRERLEEEEGESDALKQVRSLAFDIRPNIGMTVLAVKGEFFRLLVEVTEQAKRKGLASWSSRYEAEALWDLLNGAQTLDETADAVCGLIREYYAEERRMRQNSSALSRILAYVHQHYSQSELSISEIASHVFLSPAYMCTYFKQETGKTLNQYITDYRIEKSIELLRLPDMRISEVSDKVGYADCNYFAKLFRKATGVSPSKFKERHLGVAVDAAEK